MEQQLPTSRSRRAIVAPWFVALIAFAFVVIGLRLALTGGVDPSQANELAVRYGRVFGLRDAFLGALALALVVARERRALFLLMAGATVLPVADTIALAGPFGLAEAVPPICPTRSRSSSWML